MKILKISLLILLVAFVVMQFIRPEKNISGQVAESDIILVESPGEEIGLILKNACYDCHSNNTSYPWYAEVAPLSYWIADHVEHGTDELDFSQWALYSPKKKAHKMEELIEEVKEHKMPLESYTWMHSEANLTDDQITALTEWAKILMTKYELDAQVQ